MRRSLRSAPLSTPRESWLPFFEKCRHAFAEILAAIAHGGEVLAEAVLEMTMEHEAAEGFLGSADGQRRVVGNRLSQFAHRGVQRVHGGDACREPERDRLR